MKSVVFFLLLLALLLGSCSRKLHTAVSQKPVIQQPKDSKTDKPVAVIPPPEEVKPAVPPPIETPAFAEPLTVIDARGNIITPRSKLPPEMGAKIDYRLIARSFTPGQQKNLIYRFQLLPPRVLYVPDHLASNSARGTYVIFKKKFWYWKQADGLFHLDKTYYQ